MLLYTVVAPLAISKAGAKLQLHLDDELQLHLGGLAMNLINRARISVIRQFGKTIILLMFVLVLSSVMVGAIAVTTAIDSTQRVMRGRMPPILRIELDYENMPYDEWVEDGMLFRTNHLELVSPITRGIVNEIAELPYVDRHYYVINDWLFTNDYDFYIAPGSPRMEQGPHMAYLGDGRSVVIREGDFFVFRGTSDYEPLEMQSGVINLVQGQNFENISTRHPDDPQPALVSEGFAEVNGMSIGSIFTMSTEIMVGELWDLSGAVPDFSAGLIYIPYQFEIVGLFEVVPTKNVIPIHLAGLEEIRISDLSNRIHVPNYVLEIVKENRDAMFRHLADEHELEFAFLGEVNQDEVDFQSFFVLNDPLELQDFRKAALEILPDYWMFDDLSNSYEAVAASFETIREISQGIIWVSAGSTIIILMLLIILFLRDRGREMGVYLALGESKRKIISQILLEVMVVAFIGITASIHIGNVMSTTISHEMFLTEFAQQPSQVESAVIGSWGVNDSLFHLGFATEVTSEEALEMFDTSLSVDRILLLYTAGLTTVFIATLVPVLKVVRTKPKKILLQERIQ